MNTIKKSALPILIAAIWISISEFIRNEFLLKSYWINHFQTLGLTFPSEPINGAMWGLWSLCFAIAIYIISKKYSFLESVFLSWFIGFVLMWIVAWNLGVFPIGILVFAVPLSIFEVYIANLIYSIIR